MNYIRYISAFFVFNYFVLSCSHSEQENNLITVEVPVKTAKKIKLSSITERLDSIALETHDDNLLFRIVDIEHNEQLIIVADIDAVYKFSKDGKFIKKIGRQGQGPGEYLNVTDIALDNQSKRLYVASGVSQKIICYDLEGNFIRESKIVGLNAIKIVRGRLHGIFNTYGMPSSDNSKWFNNSYLVKFDQDFLPSDTLLIKSVKANKGTASISSGIGDQLISEANGDVYIYLGEMIQEPFVRDTLFQVENNNKSTSLKLNFGIEDRSQEELIIKSILRTENHLLVDFSLESFGGMSIINLPSKKAFVGKEYFQDDIWNTGSAKLLPWDLKDEEFYFIKEGMELIDTFNKVTGEENPFIFIVKLKTDSF